MHHTCPDCVGRHAINQNTQLSPRTALAIVVRSQFVRRPVSAAIVHLRICMSVSRRACTYTCYVDCSSECSVCWCVCFLCRSNSTRAAHVRSFGWCVSMLVACVQHKQTQCASNMPTMKTYINQARSCSTCTCSGRVSRTPTLTRQPRLPHLGGDKWCDLHGGGG